MSNDNRSDNQHNDNYTSIRIDALRAEIRAGDREVTAKLDRIIDRLARIESMQSDHEQRIRSVERWKLSIPISVLLAVATIIGALLSRGGG